MGANICPYCDRPILCNSDVAVNGIGQYVHPACSPQEKLATIRTKILGLLEDSRKLIAGSEYNELWLTTVETAIFSMEESDEGSRKEWQNEQVCTICNYPILADDEVTESAVDNGRVYHVNDCPVG